MFPVRGFGFLTPWLTLFMSNRTLSQLLNALTVTLPERFQWCARLTTGLIENGVQHAWYILSDLMNFQGEAPRFMVTLLPGSGTYVSAKQSTENMNTITLIAVIIVTDIFIFPSQRLSMESFVYS